MTTKPITRASGQVLAAADMNTEGDYWATSIDGIKRGNFGTNPGIISTDLADRYAVVPISFELIPPTSGADLSAPAQYTLPTAELIRFKHTWRWHSTKRAYIYAIEYYLASAASGTGVLIYTYLNTTLLGNAALTLASADTYGYIRNASYASSVQIPIADTDTLKVTIKEASASADAMGLRGLIMIKAELGS